MVCFVLTRHPTRRRLCRSVATSMARTGPLPPPPVTMNWFCQSLCSAYALVAVILFPKSHFSVDYIITNHLQPVDRLLLPVEPRLRYEQVRGHRGAGLAVAVAKLLDSPSQVDVAMQLHSPFQVDCCVQTKRPHEPP